jgi:hypothetical protein
MKAFSVLGPVGRHVGKTGPLAARVPDLTGKTVGEVWNGYFRGDVLFPVMRQLLEKRYPGVKIVPYTELPVLNPTGNTDELCARLKEALARTGCDAVIAGVGG